MHSKATLKIRIAAIVNNWKMLSQKASFSACAAVVKANAYGLGDKQVAKSLYLEGCRIFFVATIDEGIAVRSVLPASAEVLVLGGLTHVSSGRPQIEWISYALTPVLLSSEHVQMWSAFCRSLGRVLPYALKVDTGMHRFGLLPAELGDLLDSGKLAQLQPKYLISHFACADTPQHPLNIRQVQEFSALGQKVKRYLPKIRLSLANSSGVFLSCAAHFDLVRPGAALYGVNPTPKQENPMLPVVSLQVPVAQVKYIEEGHIGYGAAFSVVKPIRVAVVFGGYADGLHRALSGRGRAYCNGVKVATVGRIAMDSIVFDVTHVPGDIQWIDWLGEEQTIDDLAVGMGTIAYEVLTSLGYRYQKHYL